MCIFLKELLSLGDQESNQEEAEEMNEDRVQHSQIAYPLNFPLAHPHSVFSGQDFL